MSPIGEKKKNSKCSSIPSSVRLKCNVENIVDKGVAIKDDDRVQNDDFGNNMEIHSQVMGSSSPMLKGTVLNRKV